MIKKSSLLIVIISFSALSSFSAVLPGTSWIVYDSSNTSIGYFQFSADSLYYSSDNITFYPLSAYWENGNQFRIVDRPGGLCAAADTGKYNFSILNDTLHFNITNEPCTDRGATLAYFHWVRLLSGIDDLNKLPDFTVFPNPVEDVLFISNTDNEAAELTVYDNSGRVVMKQNVHHSGAIPVNNLSKGIYFYNFIDTKGKIVKGKFMKR